MERRRSERRNGQRRLRERRNRDESRVTSLPSDLGPGWLAFQTGRQRRRLAPIPNDWISLPEEDLRVLNERAIPSQRLR